MKGSVSGGTQWMKGWPDQLARETSVTGLLRFLDYGMYWLADYTFSVSEGLHRGLERLRLRRPFGWGHNELFYSTVKDLGRGVGSFSNDQYCRKRIDWHVENRVRCKWRGYGWIAVWISWKSSWIAIQYNVQTPYPFRFVEWQCYWNCRCVMYMPIDWEQTR